MRIWKFLFMVWVFFWIFFLIRGLQKGGLEEYKDLLVRSPDERRAYIIGEDLYKFLRFSLENISKDGTYKIAGYPEPIDRYRLIYYLYPRRESDNPEYILCYSVDKDFSQEGFYRFATFKDSQFILKRRKGD